MKKKTDEVALLEKQLANTQKLFQQEKLKREAFSAMINIVENKLNIPIRKKSAGPLFRFEG